MNVGDLVKHIASPAIGIITALNRWDQRPLVFVRWTANQQDLPDCWWHNTKVEVLCEYVI